jgi:CheY-like chemotaxis protein/predicted regulator of Ras-like GTPase activity (Roadblock/LC7/MglB family)
MHNILVVSGDESFLKSLETEFARHSDKYRLFAENDVKQALSIFENEAIDFVSTALNLPDMNGMPFLSMLNRIKPKIPIVVLTSEESTQMGDTFLKMGVRQVLIEPVTPQRLIECIQEVLFLKTQQGRLQGISIVNFLQLIEMEKKTYLLEVHSQAGDKGLFYFRDGDMYDALSGDLNGEAAALEMITWDNVEIRFRTPPTKKVHRRIDKSLMSLLMDGALLKDERTDGKGSTEAEVTAESPIWDEVELPEPETDVWGGEVSFEEPESTPDTDSDKETEVALSEESGQASAGASVSGEVIQEMFGVRGVKAVTLLNSSGKVLGALGSWPGSELDELADSVFTVHGGAMRMVRELDLLNISNLALESNDATILCVPFGTHLLVILASDSKTLGIIRQKAMKLSQEYESSQ